MDNAFATVVSGRVCDVSKSGYMSKLNVFKKYLMAEEGKRGMHFIDNSIEIILPLDDNIYTDFFGWLSTNTDLPKRTKRRGTKRRASEEDGAVNNDAAAAAADDDDDADEAEGNAIFYL